MALGNHGNKPPVALYYTSLEHSGGIERVVVEQTRIFTQKGYPCVLLTNEKPKFYNSRIQCKYQVLSTDIDKRTNEWENILYDNRIKFVILNSAVDSFVNQDIDAIKRCGAKVINTIHFSFPSPILFNGDWKSLKINKDIGEKCDAVATVNKLDAIWWRAMGCNAYPVRNPFTYYEHSNNEKDYSSHTIVWVGRGAAPKKPADALHIIAEVAKVVPDVKLYMVGLGQSAYTKKIKQLGIKNNVIFVPPTDEIGRYYEQASIHLLTSITESFCLVVAEAKSYRIPTIMYNIPFVELVEDGRGAIIHKQGDITGMANSIISLFNNPDSIKQLGEDAFESLSDFNDDEVVAQWQAIFDSLERGESHKPDTMDCTGIIVREIYSAWMNHCEQNVWKFEFFDNIERATGKSAKKVINGITNRIIEPLKKIKRIF